MRPTRQPLSTSGGQNGEGQLEQDLEHQDAQEKPGQKGQEPEQEEEVRMLTSEE
jgi:hypothetical protein